MALSARNRTIWSVIAALLVFVAVEAMVQVTFIRAEYRDLQFITAHRGYEGVPDPATCAGGKTYSPDGLYVVYNDNPCWYSPAGTVIAVYGASEPMAYGSYQTTNAILNMKSGGPVYTMWKTNRELIVVCNHCRADNAWFFKRQFRDVNVDFLFEDVGATGSK